MARSGRSPNSTVAKATVKPTQSVKLTPKEPGTKATVASRSKAATIATTAQHIETKAVLKKAELLEKVVTQTGVKKRDAKVVIEATLASIADALTDSTEVNLPPLGKIRPVKSKEINQGAKVLTLKLRTMKTLQKSSEDLNE